jgi:hypothetical protein
MVDLLYSMDLHLTLNHVVIYKMYIHTKLIKYYQEES